MRIEPSLGRIVLFFPAIDDGRHQDGQPFSAMIAGVNDDGSINLMVAARDGSPYGAQNVPLLQDGDDIDQDKPHAAWMPYQKGQAAKTDAAIAAAGVDPVKLLEPAHERIAAVEAATQNKFEELGAWFTKTLTDFEQRLAAISAKPADPPVLGADGQPVGASPANPQPQT